MTDTRYRNALIEFLERFRRVAEREDRDTVEKPERK